MAARDRLTTARRSVRRAVLARRRLLAAGLAAAAVASGVQAARADAPATVSVLVAARDLPAGTVLGADDLVRAAYAPESVPQGLARSAVGRTLAAPMRAGEPFTDVRLVGPALTDGYPGRVALPVRLPDAGVVALLRVGDRVDLVAADPRAGSATVVAHGVPVLALPTAAAEVGPTGTPGRLVVVGAAPAEVAPIADAAARTLVTVAFGD